MNFLHNNHRRRSLSQFTMELWNMIPNSKPITMPLNHLFLYDAGDQRTDDDTTNSICSLEESGDKQVELQNERLSKRKKSRYSSQVLMENWDYENMLYPDTTSDTACNHCYPCSFFCKEVNELSVIVL